MILNKIIGYSNNGELFLIISNKLKAWLGFDKILKIMHFDGDIILAKLYSDRNDDYFIYEKSTNFLAFIYCTSHDYGRRRTYSMNINYEKFPNNLFLQQFLINIFKDEERLAHINAIYYSADFYTTKTRIRFNDLWNKFINEELNIDIK